MTVTIEARIGRVLTAGRWISTALLALGLALLLTTTFTRFTDIVINAGLISLYATPVARVVVGTVGFAESHEWKFVTMTLAVLCVLIGSILAGCLS